MVDAFDTSGGQIVVTDGTTEKFATDKKQFLRVPQGTITATVSITFNDLDKGYNYYYRTYAGAHGTAEQCAVNGKLIGQEWGPSAAPFSYVAPHALADVDLGAVPNGCDYLDVSVNLTRTQAPADPNWSKPLYNQWDWPIEFEEGQWIHLPDNALCVERFVGMSRMFWLEIVSGRVLLRRRQSVMSSSGAPFQNPDNKQGLETHVLVQTGGNAVSGIGKQNDPGLNQLDGTHVNGTGCAANNQLNTTSVYSGTIKIVPCCTL